MQRGEKVRFSPTMIWLFTHTAGKSNPRGTSTDSSQTNAAVADRRETWKGLFDQAGIDPPKSRRSKKPTTYQPTPAYVSYVPKDYRSHQRAHQSPLPHHQHGHPTTASNNPTHHTSPANIQDRRTYSDVVSYGSAKTHPSQARREAYDQSCVTSQIQNQQFSWSNPISLHHQSTSSPPSRYTTNPPVILVWHYIFTKVSKPSRRGEMISSPRR